MADTYTNRAYAAVRNESDVPLKNVTLHHQYSDDPDEGKCWPALAPHDTTPPMAVHYNTGFIRYGDDYWWLQYQLSDGSTWVSPGRIVQTLRANDEGQTIIFTVSGSLFSGVSDSMQLSKTTLPNYNAWAAITLRNEFPVSASAELAHRYGDDNRRTHAFPVLESGHGTDAADAFIVHYQTGIIETGTDQWDIEVKLDIPPYDNQPEAAFKAFTNVTPGKNCMLQAADNGKIHRFTLRGNGLRLGIASGACSDDWVTWNGYNRLAFLRVKNEFDTDISTVVLQHQYSDYERWRQTRALIQRGKESSLMVVEYNTGFMRYGLDYWDVFVYLEDGTWYQNHKRGKECMLEDDDALTTSILTVSPDTFVLGLESGSCQDAMDAMGEFAPGLGRDVNRRYDENAYIGSHNAYANFAVGFWYAQQTGALETQLAQGSTVLLLDIWEMDGDIYLLHEGIEAAQPFAKPRQLSEALTLIREFLTLQRRDPVTIIFEDRVAAESQHLIKDAFITSKTWDMVFDPIAYGVPRKGWPSLAEFFPLRKPLIVLTSNSNSRHFAYQWSFMSENVWGDKSLDPVTYLKPRDRSDPLNQHSLCALNHFPDWSPESFYLYPGLAGARKNNASGIVSEMIDSCHAQYGRFPNYINADFWEVPGENGLGQVILDLNAKLHGVSQPVLRFQHGRAITREIDHSRLLVGDWQRATRWVAAHFDRICPDPQTGEGEHLTPQLTNAINLALVVSLVRAGTRSAETSVSAWVRTVSRELVRYLLRVEHHVVASLDFDAFGTSNELCAVPYFLLEHEADIAFDITEIVRRRTRDSDVSQNLDRALLQGLAGHPDAGAQLDRRLAASRTERFDTAVTTRGYDLTHGIFYRTLITPESDDRPDPGAPVAELLDSVMALNQDLGAELLACHWLTGGSVDALGRTAVQRLKVHSERLSFDCAVGTGHGCRCSGFKEEVHRRLTMLLGLGVTLGVVGEVLDQAAPGGAPSGPGS